MNSRVKKSLLFGLICIAFLVFVISCTSIKNILGWSKSSDSRDPSISQFFSDMRPHPGNPNSHYLLACYYQERGRHKEAIEEFRKVLLIEPTYVKAYNGIGVSNDLLGDFDTAIKYYNMALSLNPNLDYIYNNLGYSYLLQGNLDDSIVALKRAIVINGKDQRFHNNLGLAYGEKGEFDLALAEFKLASDKAKAHHNMAQLYFKKGLLEEAKSHYAIALKLNPSLTVVRTALKAADALGRIFEPLPDKVEPKQLVIPDQPIIGKEETEKSIIEDRPTTEEAKLEERVFPDQSINGKIKDEELVTPEQFTERKVKIEELETLTQRAILKAKEVPAHKYLKYPEESIIHEQHPQKKSLNSLKDAGIEISNGNGAYRMAKKVADYLKEKGLKVTRLTNANNFNHSGTKIFYQKEYNEAGEYVAEQLPVFWSKEETEKFDRPNIKIKIVIGKDLVPHHKTFENGKKS